jgi:hypothetical protein
LSRIYSPSPGLGQASKIQSLISPVLLSRVRRLSPQSFTPVTNSQPCRWSHAGPTRTASLRLASRSLSHPHTHTLSLTLSLSLTHSLTHSLTLSLSHSLTLSLSLSLSLSLTLSLSAAAGITTLAHRPSSSLARVLISGTSLGYLILLFSELARGPSLRNITASTTDSTDPLTIFFMDFIQRFCARQVI